MTDLRIRISVPQEVISLSDDPENEDGAKSPVDCLLHLSGQSDSSPGGNDIGAIQRFHFR